MSGEDEDGDDHPRRNRSLGGGGGRFGGGEDGRDDDEDGRDHDEGSADDHERGDTHGIDRARDDATSGGRAHEEDGDDDDGDRLGGDEAAGADVPLSDLRRDVDERREQEGGGADGGDVDFEELFAEMEVGDVDEDDVWEALSESADEPVVEPDAVTADTGAVGGTGDDGDVTVVEKSLCHGCPNFAAPPETACTHEGTTIAAEVDTDHFRVVDCPIVAQREARDDPSDFSADTE